MADNNGLGQSFPTVEIKIMKTMERAITNI